MGMDRNTVIGFVLIGALLIAMFVINSKSRLAYEGEQKRIADSIAATKPKPDTIAIKKDAAQADSQRIAGQTAAFGAGPHQQQFTTVENEVLKITFTNKGAQPFRVELKKYKKLDGTPVILQEGNFNKLTYRINTDANQTAETENLIFSPGSVLENNDKSKTVTFFVSDSTGKEISHQYTIHPDNYLIDFNIGLKGSDRLFSQNTIGLLWQNETEQVEKDYKYEQTQTHICYLKNESYDFEYLGTGDDLDFLLQHCWLKINSIVLLFSGPHLLRMIRLHITLPDLWQILN